MNAALIDRIVNSVLYEGYLLYPYRQAIKNVKRWTFGSIYPGIRARHKAAPSDCWLRARCLVEGGAAAVVDVELRFLQLVERQTMGEAAAAAECWHESVERRVGLGPRSLEELTRAPCRQVFEFPQAARQTFEKAVDGSRQAVVRRQLAIQGTVDASAEPVGEGVALLTVSVANETPRGGSDELGCGGHTALLQSMASAHLVLRAAAGSSCRGSILRPTTANCAPPIQATDCGRC